jgi:hypothetical protein
MAFTCKFQPGSGMKYKRRPYAGLVATPYNAEEKGQQRTPSIHTNCRWHIGIHRKVCIISGF